MRIHQSYLHKLKRLDVYNAMIENLKKPAVISSHNNVSDTTDFQTVLIKSKELSRRIEKEIGGVGFKNEPSKRISVLSHPDKNFIISLLSTWDTGNCFVPLCTSHPAKELKYIIENSDSKLILYHSCFKNKINELKLEIEDNNQIKYLQLDSNTKSDLVGVEEETFEISSKNFDKSLAAVIIYTSGTTGKPKGVVLTHLNIEAQIRSLQSAWGWEKDDKILNVLPLHHVHGLINVVFCALFTGASLEMNNGFKAIDVWKRFNTESQDLTLFMAVPTIYSKLIEEFHKMSKDDQIKSKNSLRQFRLMVSGSAALPEKIFEKWEAISGHKLLERYGMTEIGMVLGNPLIGERTSGEVGVPFPGVKLKILSDEGIDITNDCNKNGQLLVKGDQISVGYWNNSKANFESFDSEGYFKTGDIVKRGDNGRFKILGRASVDVIKIGGYKVSALEIEREILEMDNVKECSVFGKFDEVYGEKIICLVVLQNETLKFDLTQMRKFLQDKLAPYKIPQVLLVLKEIPKNIMGK
ncbi:hypothetical protein HDU92_003557, partial [Lobulomyces angularis]